jgi:hypothetical protein
LNTPVITGSTSIRQVLRASNLESAMSSKTKQSGRVDIDHVGAPMMSTPRLQRLAAQIHTLGPRPLFELLLELDAGAELRPTLERYARLAPLAGFIAANHGDRLASALRAVGGR